MTTLTVELPDEMKSGLHEVSCQRRRTLSDSAQKSLRRCIAVEKFRSVRKKILPLAEAQGLLTDEDIFRTLS